jgi:shikimate dehydrogenase
MIIDGHTKLVGLLGYPLGHSFSPRLQNAAFTEMALNWVYIPLPVSPSALSGAMAGLRSMEFIGANVTIPHKQAIMPLLDELSPAARSIGAVNTIVLRNGCLSGENTDVSGFLASLTEAGFNPARRSAGVLGGGGAARAVCYALAAAGVDRLYLFNRTPRHADDIITDLKKIFPAVDFHCHTLAEVSRMTAGIELLVNATSIGMQPDINSCPLPEETPYSAGVVYYDCIYNPLETQFLTRARQAGGKTISGLSMLIHQGAEALRIWSGLEPPLEIMRKVALDAAIPHRG